MTEPIPLVKYGTWQQVHVDLITDSQMMELLKRENEREIAKYITILEPVQQLVLSEMESNLIHRTEPGYVIVSHSAYGIELEKK